jgi:hypothetical protein
MDLMIGYCGLTCQACPIYWATKEENKEKREKMRAEISRLCNEHYGTDFKAEDITDCDGCKAESNRLFLGCTKCEIRICARQKELENCAHCSDYACEKLKEFFQKESYAKVWLDVIKSTL